jgi:alpha-2-macroglobulin
MRMCRPVLLLLCVFVSFVDSPSECASAQSEATGPLRITSITPRGTEVPSGRQIVLQFDRKVVPVGRMERRADEVPITIEPALACEWRWIDTSALACELGETDAFRPATRYRITVRPGIATETGATLAAPVEEFFETERPKVTSAAFQQWLGPGSPQFYVTFNQQMAAETLRAGLHFATEAGRKFGVEVELANPGVEDPARLRYWQIQPASLLPPGAVVSLVAGKGLTSLEGPLATVEDNRVVTLYTFPEHRFLGVRCRDNGGKEVFLRPEGVGPGRPCNPMEPVEVVFSSPIVKEVLQEHLAIDPDLASGREDYEPWDAVYSFSRLSYARSQSETYPTTLPELLHARTTYEIRAKASELLDEFGRPLASDVDFVFTTDDRPPRAVLTHPVSTLEKNVDTQVPIVVTNLDSFRVEGEALTADGLRSFSATVPLAKAENVAYRLPLPTRDWLGAPSGVLFGNVSTTPATEMSPARFFSQVTPFAVHAKMGHQNTAVWVTDMATGEPVEGAHVFLYRATPASALASREPLAESETDATGVAMLKGQAELNPLLETTRWESIWEQGAGPTFFVSVEKNGDVALTPLSSDFWVYIEGTNNSWVPSYSRTRYGHVRTWGTTAQGVYRLGDTIQYKLYVRDQDNDRYVPAPPRTYHLAVYDPMDKMIYEVKDLELNPFGAADGSIPVAETGAVGWYRFELTSDFTQESWQPLRVLVADFTPAPFRVTTDLDGDRYEPGDELKVSTSAKLHAGGPYADAESRVTVNVTPVAISSRNPKAAGFWFGESSGETVTVHQSEDKVSAAGELETDLVVPDQGFPRGRLVVESAVRDDRGKYIAGRASAEYMGRDRFVGLRNDGWLLHVGESSDFLAIVLDTEDKVQTGTEITFRVQYREVTAARVKGAGNAYITQYNEEWLDVTTCAAVSTEEPSSCRFTPDRPGLYRLSASIADSNGRAEDVALDRWAAGKGQVVWEESPGNRLDIEPEKTEYRVGDKARFLVKNPFPGAKALVTVERYGVQRHWIETLAESTAVIEVDVGEDQVPGFYLSVVVMSPRVEAPLGEDEVDLGKPAFRMGYVQVPVRDPVKEIALEVHPERDLYKPRDKVKVTLQAKPRLWAGTKLPPMEVAVAVLDEAVFDLIGDGDAYFDPYRGFYSLEPLDVENFNLLTRLIGIQKFEKKGASPGGGGGGGADLRTLFKFVSYWNPSIVLDDQGRASFELEVPDNLTGWRILALVVTDGDRMGLGQGHFVVNQPTELRTALPNQVTEGDRFDARFTVMNRTEEVRTLTVTGAVAGEGVESPGLPEQTIEAEPYKRYPVSFPVETSTAGPLTFTVRASDRVDGDGLRLMLDVKKRKALEVAATYGTTTDSEATESFLFPENMRTDVGRLSLTASPSVLGNLEGAFEYLRDYPYLCWEQKITKAVMASHFDELHAYIRGDFTWPDHENIPDATLALAANYQAPNGGMVYWIPEDEYASPYLSAYTALAFHWLRERGHAVPASVEQRLQDYLRSFLRQDAFPDFYDRGMASTVRAVALAALAMSGSLDPADLERYRSHVEEMDLFGKAHFLMAANAIGVDASAVRDAILAHSNQSGGKVTFTETLDDGFRRILYSAERTECAVLSALTRGGAGAPEGSGVGDLPFRITREITQVRAKRDRWENTQENVFCMNALVDYSHVYERETPSYTLRTYFGGELLGESKISSLRDDAVEHERSLRASDPGAHGELRLSKLGPGRVYYAARLFYSPKEIKKDAIDSGIEVHREYQVQRNGQWELLQSPMRIETGELVKVDLFVSLPAPRNFVVVDDPVPGGLEPVNRDLATASTVDADAGEYQGAAASFWFTRDDWFSFGYSRWSFYHKELRHEAARFFSEYLPAGSYHLSYVAQAIASGEFQVLPVHAEEMYDPDVFGQGTPATLVVEQPR